MEANPPETSLPEPPQRQRVNWPLFAGWLFGPSVLAFAAALAKAEGLATAAALGGGIIGGIVCGTIVARRSGKTATSRVLIGILSAVAFTLLSLGISFVGCIAAFR